MYAKKTGRNYFDGVFCDSLRTTLSAEDAKRKQNQQNLTICEAGTNRNTSAGGCIVTKSLEKRFFT